jgi:hypothetical protein
LAAGLARLIVLTRSQPAERHRQAKSLR